VTPRRQRKLASLCERAGLPPERAAGIPRQERLWAAGAAAAALVPVFVGAPIWLPLALAPAGFLLPKLRLERRALRRRREILLALPYALDLLTLVQEAGLDLVAGVEELLARDRPGPLEEELALTLRAIRLGETRARAFRALAERTGLEALSLLAAAVAQSEELGARLGGLLRLTAASVRSETQRAAEERAQRAPVRMLLPLVLLIFPVLFLILFVPLFLNLTTAVQ
jgi:tight adherence protein C